MNQSLVGRQVAGFRCQIDPMIGPKPRNAFVPKDMAMEAHLLDCGIYVKVLPYGTFIGSEHIVPFANVQSIRLEPQTESTLQTASGSDIQYEFKRKPGRPVGS